MSFTDNRLQGRVVWYRWERVSLSLNWLLLWNTMYILFGFQDRLDSYVFELLNGDKRDPCGKWQFVVSGSSHQVASFQLLKPKAYPCHKARFTMHIAPYWIDHLFTSCYSSTSPCKTSSSYNPLLVFSLIQQHNPGTKSHLTTHTPLP